MALESRYGSCCEIPMTILGAREASGPEPSEQRRRLALEKENQFAERAGGGMLTGMAVTNPRLPDNPVVSVCRGFSEITGYSAGEVLGRNCRFLQGPGTDQKTVAALRQALAEAKPFKGRILNYRKNGAPFWNELTILPIFDQTGELAYFVGVQADVSRGQRTMEALSATKRQLETVFANAPILLFALDERGTFILADGQEQTPFGLPPGLLLGQSIREVWPRGSEMEALFERALAGENLTEQVAASDRVFDVSFSPLQDDPGGRKGVMMVATDVTGRARALAALEQAEANYRGIFENAVVGAFQSTPDGRYLRVNQALARMYGYDTAAELVGAVNDIAAQIYVNPAAREDFLRRVENQGRVEGLEYQVRRRDGGTIWICENTRAVEDASGRVLHYEGTVQDISGRREAELERERLENQLQQAQKMEAVGTLAGGIAHDFNNILSAIMGYTELSLQELGLGDPIRSNLDEVLSASRRARDLVRQILAFSRRDETLRHPICLSRLAREALKLANAALPAGITCACKPGTKENWILADGTQIHQVLMNLITNAGHAMRDRGGRLEIRLDHEPPPASLALPAEPYVRLSVTDTGVGMGPEVQKRVFEPFFTTKPRGEGTGLGLAVVHGIVTGHGGGVAIESAAGQGTAFHLWFPRVLAQTRLEEAAPVWVRGNARLLFVDDEETLAALAQKHLRKLGYRITTRLDSRVALAAFLDEPDAFDAVITDLEMPSLDGLQLCAEMRRVRADLPVFLCTGQAPALEAESTRRAGFTGLFSKPVDFRDLARALALVTNRKPAVKRPGLARF